jgi:hypothetical protein
MKFGQKFFSVLGLVAILASLFVSTALAGGTKIARFANVSKITVVNNQPATFRLLGDITCTKVQLNSSVSGKVISIYAYDLKALGNGQPCGPSKGFRREITVGPLVPGQYTVLVNPDGTGQAQRKFTFFAPVLPATATPVAPAKP